MARLERRSIEGMVSSTLGVRESEREKRRERKRERDGEKERERKRARERETSTGDVRKDWRVW